MGRNMGRTVLWLTALLLVIPMVSASESYSYQTEEGTAWFDCHDSWASIHDEQGVELENSSDFTASLSPGNHTFFIGDKDHCQWVIPVTPELPNSLPAPSDNFSSQQTLECPQPYLLQSSCVPVLVSGDLVNDPEDVFAIDVISGQFLKLGLEAASSSIDIEIYFQNDSSSVKLDSEISLALNTSIDQNYALNIPVEQDGRILVSVTSPSPNAYWMIGYELYSTSNSLELVNLDDITGIGKVPFTLDIGRDESLIISSSSSMTEGTELELNYRYAYSEASYSNWTNASVGDRIHSMESIDYIELFWNCDCEWSSSMVKESHFDAEWGRDAPGYRPLSPNSDNSSYH